MKAFGRAIGTAALAVVAISDQAFSQSQSELSELSEKALSRAEELLKISSSIEAQPIPRKILGQYCDVVQLALAKERDYRGKRHFFAGNSFSCHQKRSEGIIISDGSAEAEINSVLKALDRSRGTFEYFRDTYNLSGQVLKSPQLNAVEFKYQYDSSHVPRGDARSPIEATFLVVSDAGGSKIQTLIFHRREKPVVVNHTEVSLNILEGLVDTLSNRLVTKFEPSTELFVCDRVSQ
jgi:hypothetical protein